MKYIEEKYVEDKRAYPGYSTRHTKENNIPFSVNEIKEIEKIYGECRKDYNEDNECIAFYIRYQQKSDRMFRELKTKMYYCKKDKKSNLKKSVIIGIFPSNILNEFDNWKIEDIKEYLYNEGTFFTKEEMEECNKRYHDKGDPELLYNKRNQCVGLIYS